MLDKRLLAVCLPFVSLTFIENRTIFSVYILFRTLLTKRKMIEIEHSKHKKREDLLLFVDFSYFLNH